jgi:hypothetical protein
VRSKEPSSWSGSQGPTPFPVDGPRVGDLLDRLSGLSGVGFETAAPATQATGTIAVDGEHGELARFQFGPLAPVPGSDVESLWITTPARPGVVFRIHATSFGPIPAKAEDSRSRGSRGVAFRGEGNVRVLVQRVSRAEVRVDGAIVGSIARGLLVYLGVENGDDVDDATWNAAKTAQLRIFPDDAGG